MITSTHSNRDDAHPHQDPIFGNELWGEPKVSLVTAGVLRNWNGHLSPTDRQLKCWLTPLRRTNNSPDDERTRVWMATDWMVRVHTPAWLRLAGLTNQADLLASLTPVSPDTAFEVRASLNTMRSDIVGAWTASPMSDAEAWDAACTAVGEAAGDAVGAPAGDVTGASVRAGIWVAARVIARVAAGIAVRDAGRVLQPTVADLQASAHLLIGHMVAVGSSDADVSA